MLKPCVFLLWIVCITGIHAEDCVKGTYPPEGRPSVPSYIVDLDLPPGLRWANVVDSRGPGMQKLIGIVKSMLSGFGKFSTFLIDFLDKDVGYLADTFPEPYGHEIKGISKATGIPLGEVVLYNIFYEVFTVCTSIVAENPSGELFHARNLDFGLFMGWNSKNHTWAVTEALRPLIVNLDFRRGNRTVFRSVNFAGYVGVLTGFKPNLFSLTMNERFNVDGGFIGIIKWIMGSRNIQWMSFLTRNTLQDATSYADAKKRLKDTPMLAPAYYILGGNRSGEACVITRAREAAVDVWEMRSKSPNWFILETNYDHWKNPFILDDRRTPAIKCMISMTQPLVGFSGIFDVLSTRPVLNKLTTYTALMQVNSNRLETYLQYCPDPCAPW